MSEIKQYCSFFVGDHYFGVDVREVQEVMRYQEMTRVPLAPAEVAGLINLRGQIVTAVDIRQRLGLPQRPQSQLPMNVVVRCDDSAVSLLVDEIGDVLQVEEAAYEAPPATLTGVCRDVTTGVYKLKDRLLLILDIAVTMSLSASAAEVSNAA
jgi:purine-binding chemotaxis protein CheW